MTKNEVLHDLDSVRMELERRAEHDEEWWESQGKSRAAIYRRQAKALEFAMKAVQEFDDDEWDHIVSMDEEIDRDREFDA